ncbi:hypothetical protein NQ036_03680 [Brevibacterium sp. 91QC2O2]|uniref:VG15 protein n=1 Tax=Brevibacterium TaxID=1696 RepID=UPI00211C1826|nr:MULTISPECIES: hypothetical protein [unclassified Brevibacterium]MCQ9367347.1 hypothetical protein [Brevibacterium sp. 91QC2O2]MCQ9384640.1 hypothetical protein [Brevibacterium sp. 68QC2CO]
MPTRAQTNRLADAQNAVTDQVQQELARIWAKLDADPLRARQQLEEIFPALLEKFGDVAATAAAEWFEERTGQRAVLADPIPADQANSSLRWAMGPAFDGDWDTALANLASVADRLVRAQGKDTVQTSAQRRKVRFARVPAGRTTCSFCTMLASRGFVYTDRNTAGGLNRYHAHCDCQIVPEDGTVPAGYDPEALYDQYQEARSQLPDDGKYATAEEIMTKMRELHPERYTDGIWPRLPTGTSKDGTLQLSKYEQHRRDLLARLYQEGKTSGGDYLMPPKHPAEPPEWWPTDLPALRSKEWNHILYGFGSGGAHQKGYEWISGGTPFPPTWGPEKIAQNIAEFLQTVDITDTSQATYEGMIEGSPIRVAIGRRKGKARVITAFPPS